MILSSGQFVSAFLRKIAPKRSFTVGYKTVLKMINPKYHKNCYFSLYNEVFSCTFSGTRIWDARIYVVKTLSNNSDHSFFVSAFLSKIAPMRSFTVGYKTVLKMINLKYLEDSHKFGTFSLYIKAFKSTFFGTRIWDALIYVVKTLSNTVFWWVHFCAKLLPCDLSQWAIKLSSKW